MNTVDMRRHLAATLAGIGVLTLSGCYTILRHPQAPDPTSYDVAVVDPYGAPYRYVPSPTVVGWYEHYGPYWYYYVDPWWSSGYYPPVTGDSPPPAAPGFDRGGRLHSAPPARGGDVRTDSPGEPPRSVQSSSPTDDEDEKKKKEEEKKAGVGGRGGRK
jgi:hypothetical protein